MSERDEAVREACDHNRSLCERNRRDRLNRRLTALRPFANHYAMLVAQVERTSTRRLRFLVDEACNTPTDTNCWWAVKRVAPLIMRLAEEELGRRAREKRRRP